MIAQEFLDTIYAKADKDYGLFPPPTNAQFGLNILFKHFLGEDWYTTLSMNNEQVNTEAIFEILKKYPKKKLWLKRISRK